MGITITPAAPVNPNFDLVTGAELAQHPASLPVSNTAAANTAVSITITGVAGQRIRITHLSYSYSAAPVGNISIVVNAVTIFQLDDIASGDREITLPPDGIACAAGQNAVITLAAGGAAVVGKLNVASFMGA